MKISYLLALSMLCASTTVLAQKVMSYTRLDTFTSIDGGDDNKLQPPTWRTCDIEYDGQDRVKAMKIVIFDGSEETSTRIVNFDYSKPGEVQVVSRYLPEGTDNLVEKYYLNSEGYCTLYKDVNYGAEIEMVYDNGHLVETKGKSENQLPNSFVWQNGNIVEEIFGRHDGVASEVIKRKPTTIPMTLNFNPGEFFNMMGECEFLYVVSKGFKEKNFVKEVSSDHPLDDEYTYKFDKAKKTITVNCSRGADSYVATSVVTIKTD